MNQIKGPLSYVQSIIPIFHYGPTDRVTIDGKRHMKMTSQDAQSSNFIDENGLPERFSHEQIYLMRAQNRLKVKRNHYDEGSSQVTVKYDNVNLTNFGELKVTKALYLEDLLKEYIRFETIGKKHPVLEAKGFSQRKVSLGDKCMEFLLPIIIEIVGERWRAANGGLKTSFERITARHFRRLHEIYVSSGYDPLSLVSLKRGPKSRTLFHRDDIALWLEFAKLYADRKRPTMRACLLKLHAEIEERNAKMEPGMRRHHRPSRKCFENLIKGMGTYYLLAARYGEEHAKRKFAIVHDGVAVERPGQRVEMDEWLADLSILLTHMDIWKLLSEEEREAVKRSRVWITVAIDCATNCILAMHFSHRSPSHRSSLAALEMVVTDKTLISAIVGTGDPWWHALVPEKLYTDAGAAFIHYRFKAAVAALRCEHVIPPSGSPAARGTIESFFRTCGRRFLDYFDGRTFSNILEKGKYDSQGYATLNLDQFNQLFVRAIVDIYHNTPHSGLGFETPSDCWRRLSRECAIIEPIDSDDRRAIFGTPLTRAIGDKGVCVMGVHYNCTELQRARFEQRAVEDAPTPRITVRYGRYDISSVTCEIDGEWIEAKATIGIPRDTTVFEWVGARKNLAEIHGENAKASLSTLLAAVNDLRKAGASATAMAGLGADVILASDYDDIERRYFKSSVVDDLANFAPIMAALAIPHDPFEVGIDAFDHLIGTDDPEDDEPEVASELDAPSAFENTLFGEDVNDSDDDIFFEE
jgi:putative transposase